MLERDFVPKPLPVRDENSLVTDMNFSLLASAIRSCSNRFGKGGNNFIGSAVSAVGNFIRRNKDQSSPQGDSAYNIDLYGMASQGHLHCMTISRDLNIPSDWCLQTINSVVNSGTLVNVEAGGLWFVDT